MVMVKFLRAEGHTKSKENWNIDLLPPGCVLPLFTARDFNFTEA